jgi:hypothetical protein
MGGISRILSVAICRTVTNGMRTLLLRTLRGTEPSQRLIAYLARKIVQNEIRLKEWMHSGHAEDRDENGYDRHFSMMSKTPTCF